ncbi:LutB/LldF family L-lactate oxidation iron-sulfur protein [Pelagicoccus sp. SDUM812003]|uniref:LutB/LldF family L-lactate oxidation iron-sulfur protein n=1 Tax=Pelagicoccus sp. SDUM812003 TaxID=3041267 RepID=UPI00280C7E21|nr:LutB/LldF family L-lactate oxidation iron-sulfur protein [Pelagicoccus sp. SDUM812003]MDQ8204629.1 LutB/LldF family L-lactate oxidation iron-sulfur protein [Pelagicoccus sp. SDUM812003]
MAKLVQDIDRFVAGMKPETRASVHGSSKIKAEKRMDILAAEFDDADAVRKMAGQVKQHTLEHLADYLEQAEASLKRNGVHVHWAADGEEANRIVHDIMVQRGARKMVKSKSMVSEETELVPYLEERGMEAVETDLGEFIVQIDGDHPSHIVTPIVHKNRKEIAASFEREGLGPYTESPEELTAMARQHLRAKYLEADVGLTGANFVVAESGRIVLVTNEGNARFSMAATKTHIAMVGIEKLIPRDSDLPLFLSLLARSATGQRLTVYTQFIGGPKAESQQEGPEETHVVFLDNGRSKVLESNCREILRCIRCGACMNICPVYRQVSGHAYRHVYPGPVGAVLSPLLNRGGFSELADLPKASSLCGACQEVCPVDIPIPDLLVRLRNKGKEEHSPRTSIDTPGFGAWAMAASSPLVWKAGLTAGHAMNLTPKSLLNIHPSAKAWQKNHDLPPFEGGEFRSWLKHDAKSQGKENSK